MASLLLTVVLMAILVMAASAGEKPARLIVMLGGVFPAGIIQGVTLWKTKSGFIALTMHIN